MDSKTPDYLTADTLKAAMTRLAEEPPRPFKIILRCGNCGRLGECHYLPAECGACGHVAALDPE